MTTHRAYNTVSVTIASGAALSGAIDFESFDSLQVRMPAAWTSASIGFKVSDSQTGTYLPLYDDDGNLVQIDSPTASKAYAAPAALAAARWIKLWSQNGSAVDTNQDADRVLGVDKKS